MLLIVGALFQLRIDARAKVLFDLWNLSMKRLKFIQYRTGLTYVNVPRLPAVIWILRIDVVVFCIVHFQSAKIYK